MLFQHSKIIGQRTDVFRNIEDAFALKQASLCLKSGHVYADIGSGPSALPTLVCKRWNAVTYATDIEDSWLESQRRYAAQLGLPTERFLVRVENATKLSWADTSVDLLTAISTIEHIPGQGDREAIAEFLRVLRPGGRLVVTVPTSPSYVEQAQTFYYSGFERRYDVDSLRERLYVRGFALVDQLYLISPPAEIADRIWHEFGDVFDQQNPVDVWYKQGWHEQYADISILLSLGLIGLSASPVRDSFGACLAFVKT